jgi:hypothetical protein
MRVTLETSTDPLDLVIECVSETRFENFGVEVVVLDDSTVGDLQIEL